jgi:hypothetical protein
LKKYTREERSQWIVVKIAEVVATSMGLVAVAAQVCLLKKICDVSIS